MMFDEGGSYSEFLGDDIIVLVREGEVLSPEERDALKGFLLSLRDSRTERVKEES